jgi:hypothetical protein
MHVLEKLWAIGRVLLYVPCHKPKRVFSLALVSRAFAECMVEFDVSKRCFQHVFDVSSNPHIDVQRVWHQAAQIMRQTRCHPVLVAEMKEAMKHVPVSVEYDAETEKWSYRRKKAAIDQFNDDE